MLRARILAYDAVLVLVSDHLGSSVKHVIQPVRSDPTLSDGAAAHRHAPSARCHAPMADAFCAELDRHRGPLQP